MAGLLVVVECLLVVVAVAIATDWGASFGEVPVAGWQLQVDGEMIDLASLVEVGWGNWVVAFEQ
jgi:hypothetical protein